MKKTVVLVLLFTGLMSAHAQTTAKSGAQKHTATKASTPTQTSSKASTAAQTSSKASAAVQTAAKVDKKTKEFIIPSDTRAEFRFYGYQFPNESTKKMICFSSNRYDVGSNIANCPLGSYFNTGGMKEGDRIVYLGKVGNYGKMNYISGSGTKTIIYIQNTSFTIK